MAAPAYAGPQPPASTMTVVQPNVPLQAQQRAEVAQLISDPKAFITTISPRAQNTYSVESAYTGNTGYNTIGPGSAAMALGSQRVMRKFTSKEFEEQAPFETFGQFGMGMRGWKAGAAPDDVVGSAYIASNSGITDSNVWSNAQTGGGLMNWTMFPVVFKFLRGGLTVYTIIPYICMVTTFRHNKRTLPGLPAQIDWTPYQLDRNTHAQTNFYVDPTFMRIGSQKSGPAIDDNYWAVLSAANMCIPTQHQGDMYLSCQPFGTLNELAQFAGQFAAERLSPVDIYTFAGASCGLACAACFMGLESNAYTGYLQPISQQRVLSNRIGGLATTFLSANIVESVQDIDLKVAWSMRTSTPLIIPMLANYHNQSLEEYLKNTGISMLRYFDRTGGRSASGGKYPEKQTWLSQQLGMAFPVNENEALQVGRQYSWVGIMSQTQNVLFTPSMLTMGMNVADAGTPVSLATNLSDVLRLSLAIGYAYFQVRNSTMRSMQAAAARYDQIAEPKVVETRALKSVKLSTAKKVAAKKAETKKAARKPKELVASSTGIRKATKKTKTAAFKKISSKDTHAKLLELLADKENKPRLMHERLAVLRLQDHREDAPKDAETMQRLGIVPAAQLRKQQNQERQVLPNYQQTQEQDFTTSSTPLPMPPQYQDQSPISTLSTPQPKLTQNIISAPGFLNMVDEDNRKMTGAKTSIVAGKGMDRRWEETGALRREARAQEMQRRRALGDDDDPVENVSALLQQPEEMADGDDDDDDDDNKQQRQMRIRSKQPKKAAPTGAGKKMSTTKVDSRGLKQTSGGQFGNAGGLLGAIGGGIGSFADHMLGFSGGQFGAANGPFGGKTAQQLRDQRDLQRPY